MSDTPIAQPTVSRRSVSDDLGTAASERRPLKDDVEKEMNGKRTGNHANCAFCDCRSWLTSR